MCCNPANGRVDFEEWSAFTWYQMNCNLVSWLRPKSKKNNLRNQRDLFQLKIVFLLKDQKTSFWHFTFFLPVFWVRFLDENSIKRDEVDVHHSWHSITKKKLFIEKNKLFIAKYFWLKSKSELKQILLLQDGLIFLTSFSNMKTHKKLYLTIKYT